MDPRSLQLQSRSKRFAVQVIKFLRTIPRNDESRVIGTQLLRCSTSVGANYRSACMARSQADFVSKIGIACEEADESAYWLELLVESGAVTQVKVSELVREANELVAIFGASRKTAKESLPTTRNRQSSIDNRQS